MASGITSKSSEKHPVSGTTPSGSRRSKEDDLLTCSICQGLYTTPKALPCLHTFCEHCIREYVHTLMYDITGRFPCPTCSEQVPLPAGGVTDLPDNRHIMQILDICERTLSKKSGRAAKIAAEGEKTKENGAHGSTLKDLRSRVMNLWGNAASKISDNVVDGQVLPSAPGDQSINGSGVAGVSSSQPIAAPEEGSGQSTRCPYTRLSMMLLDVAAAEGIDMTENTAIKAEASKNKPLCNCGTHADGNTQVGDPNATYTVSSNTITASAVVHKPSCELIAAHNRETSTSAGRVSDEVKVNVVNPDSQVVNSVRFNANNDTSSNANIQNKDSKMKTVNGNIVLLANATLLVDYNTGTTETRRLPMRIIDEVANAYALGCYGSKVSDFTDVVGLALAADGNLITVSDRRDNRIISFNLAGHIYAIFSCHITINDIAMTPRGTVLVSNSEPRHPLIVEYSLQGQCLNVYGTFNKLESTHDITILFKSSLLATIAADTKTLYVLSGSDGKMIQKITGITKIGKSRHVASNSKDDMILSDDSLHVIRVLDSSGKSKSQFGKFGHLDEQLCQPLGLCCDRNDDIIIADSGNFKVKRFSKVTSVGCKKNWKLDQVLINMNSKTENSSIVSVNSLPNKASARPKVSGAPQSMGKPINVAVSSFSGKLVVLVAGSLVAEVRVYSYYERKL